jgi:hypothetical protein
LIIGVRDSNLAVGERRQVRSALTFEGDSPTEEVAAQIRLRGADPDRLARTAVPPSGARLRIKRSSITRYIGHGWSLLGRGIESRLDDILDPFSPHEVQLAAGAFRDILVVLAIARRQNDGRQARKGGGDDFFLEGIRTPWRPIPAK